MWELRCVSVSEGIDVQGSQGQIPVKLSSKHEHLPFCYVEDIIKYIQLVYPETSWIRLHRKLVSLNVNWLMENLSDEICYIQSSTS